MKNFQMTLTALIAVLAVLSMTACSSDIVEEEESLLTPEPIKSDWIDGKLTIQVGNYKTTREILIAMKEKGFALGITIDYNLRNRDFPISGKQYIIEVEVVKMFDVGLTEKTTYEETYRRYRERGYRPLTLEEMMELRLQFTDQPSIPSDHLMTVFFALIDPELGKKGHRLYIIEGQNARRFGGGIISISMEEILDPATSGRLRGHHRPDAMPDVRFAVVKE